MRGWFVCRLYEAFYLLFFGYFILKKDRMGEIEFGMVKVDFLSEGMLANAAYDILKNGVQIGASAIKERLQKWLVDDKAAKLIADSMQKLALTDEMSEKAIEKKICSSAELLELIKHIKQSSTATINQIHNGIGDNVAGNKSVNASATNS